LARSPPLNCNLINRCLFVREGQISSTRGS
jgi:hypothetical protein